MQGRANSVLSGDGNDARLGGAEDGLNWQDGTDSLTRAVEQAYVTAGAARDVITDVVHRQDSVRPTLVDAELTMVGDQQSNFIGAVAFGPIAGQLRQNGGILSGAGDNVAEFQIAVTGAPVLRTTDLQF